MVGHAAVLKASTGLCPKGLTMGGRVSVAPPVANPPVTHAFYGRMLSFGKVPYITCAMLATF